ncbi:MAG: prolipoprotein diacylglyceryl transferase [Ruminococcus sp.]|nr:prolipoprotein diacylglyceryl transferase [Ruminococcus sp.]
MITEFNQIQFPKLGWEFNIDPTAFTIGGINIQWYGILIALGLTLAVLYCFPKMKRFGIDPDRAIDAVLGGIIGGVIGARLYYVIPNWAEYQRDTFKDTFLAVINTRNGGLGIYGGIIGALIVGLLICKIKKIKMLPMLDVTVLGLLIGQGIGRWGNFVNQEAFGTNTDSFLGMTGGRIQQVINSEMQIGGSMYENGLEMVWDAPVHPCFLYESVWCLLGFALLAFWSKRRKYDGQILLMYMAWYGIERAIVEGIRTDSLMLGSIRISQAISIVIAIVSIILLVIMHFRVKRDPESYVLYASTEESRMLIEETRRKGMKGMDALDDDDDEIGILDDEDEDDETAAPDDEDGDDNDDDDISDDSDDDNNSDENAEDNTKED